MRFQFHEQKMLLHSPSDKIVEDAIRVFHQRGMDAELLQAYMVGWLIESYNNLRTDYQTAIDDLKKCENSHERI